MSSNNTKTDTIIPFANGNTYEQIKTDDNNVIVKFNKFNLDNYDLFLRTKQIPEAVIDYDFENDVYYVSAPKHFSKFLGISDTQINDAKIYLPDFLFDYQKYIVLTALERKRYACFADTGLGKTLMLLTFALNVLSITKKKVLILSPLEIISQTSQEANRFFNPDYLMCFGLEYFLFQIKSRDELVSWLKDNSKNNIGIINYDKFVGNETIKELAYLGGLVADESSIFKNGGGKIKWNIVKAAASVEYKLSLTATPAPNDLFEYSSQLSFLFRDKMSVLNAFWKHFNKDKRGNWILKEHAKENLYSHMASWSIYMRNPANYGFKDNDVSQIPEPETFIYEIDMTPEQERELKELSFIYNGALFTDDRVSLPLRNKMNQLAKGFYLDENKKPRFISTKKTDMIVELAQNEVSAGLQIIIWTVYNVEAEIIKERLQDKITIENLDGFTSREKRIEIIQKFKNGEIDCLISKPILLGYGLNFQNCRSMIYSGWNDSYEQFYQSVRRSYRYGQTHKLRIHIPIIRELEGIIYDNIIRKQSNYFEQINLHEQAYIKKYRNII